MRFFLKSCRQCGFSETQRAQRTWWMRLMPGYRHYHCGVCNQALLARKAVVEANPWATTTVIPPPPRKQPVRK